MSWECLAFPVSSFKGFQLSVWFKRFVVAGDDLPGERVFSKGVQISDLLPSRAPCAYSVGMSCWGGGPGQGGQHLPGNRWSVGPAVGQPLQNLWREGKGEEVAGLHSWRADRRGKAGPRHQSWNRCTQQPVPDPHFTGRA